MKTGFAHGGYYVTRYSKQIAQRRGIAALPTIGATSGVPGPRNKFDGSHDLKKARPVPLSAGLLFAAFPQRISLPNRSI